MALTEAPDELPAPEKPARGGSMIKLIGAMILMTIVAAGMGGGLGIKLADQVAEAERAKAEEEGAKPVELLHYTGPTHLKALAPVVTNLASPHDTWIRLEASIVFDDEAIDTDDVLASKITEDFLAYFRTVGLSQIDGPSGMQHLREDLADLARIRSEGRVHEVVIQTLVFQ